MSTPYCGRATIGGRAAEVDIPNVDGPRWKGTAQVSGAVIDSADTLVTLLEQPRPGWNARAVATGDADGVVHLQGIGQFFAPRPTPHAGNRSLWVKKSPRPT